MKRRTWLIAGLVLALAAAVVLSTQISWPAQHRIYPDEGGVWGIAFSPDSKTLALAGDSRVKLWDVASRKEVASLEGHTGRVYCAAFSPDGKLLASGSEDHTVRLWQMPSGKEVATLKGHTGRVKSVAFSPDGKVLASGGAERPILRLWDVASGKPKSDLKPWFEASGEQKDLEEHGQGEVLCLAFSPDGKFLALAKVGAPALLCDLATGRVTIFPEDHRGTVDSLAFSPDGKFLSTGEYGGIGQLWEVVTGKEVITYERGGRHVAFSPDGKTLAASSGHLWLWDVTTGKERAVLVHGQKTLWGSHECMVSEVAFSPDGRTLVTGGINGTIMLWDVAALLKGSK